MHVGLWGLLSWAVVPLFASESKPEESIPRLEFRIVESDLDSDESSEPSAAAASQPVTSFQYTARIRSRGGKEDWVREDVVCQSPDGILRIAEPCPPFGRIRIWVEADDLQKGYRTGFGEFSYHIDSGKSSSPPTITLKQRTVITGKVVDAETGKPIPNAEVAPTKWGHHFPWADWSDVTKTDSDGKYRIKTTSIEGVEARCPKYRNQRLGFDSQGMKKSLQNSLNKDMEGTKSKEEPKSDSDGVVVRMSPLMEIHGKVLDPDGKPVSDVKIDLYDQHLGAYSDQNGLFVLPVTQDEWANRKSKKVQLFAMGFHWADVPLDTFSREKPTTVTLQREAVISGQILGEDGNPLEQCKVELKCESEHSRSSFYKVPGPDKAGKWQNTFSKYNTHFTLRVSVKGITRCIQKVTLAEVKKGPIITKLTKGHSLSGKLAARVPLHEKNTPEITLRLADGEEPLSPQMGSDGQFAFPSLPNGSYTLTLIPAQYRLRRGGHMSPGVGGFSRFGSPASNKPWEKNIVIKDGDIQLEPIDLHEAGLLPGSLEGVVYQPQAPNKPFANATGYICLTKGDYDTVGGCYYLLDFMTDAQGRFSVEACPPGEYVLVFSSSWGGYGFRDPAVGIRVAPEKTLHLKLFSSDADKQLQLRLKCGSGSKSDLAAATAFDEAFYAKCTDQKKQFADLEYPRETFRIEKLLVLCTAKPLGRPTSWPIEGEPYPFSPAELSETGFTTLKVPHLTAGRYKIMLSVMTQGSSPFDTVWEGEIDFNPDSPTLEVSLPASSLAGYFGLAGEKSGWYNAEVEAIPKTPGLPKRKIPSNMAFRFVGLAPGEYSLVIRTSATKEKIVEKILVEKGKTTWLPKIILEPLPADQPPSGGPPTMSVSPAGPPVMPIPPHSR